MAKGDGKRGGPRPGAGRKSRAEEAGLSDLLNKVVGGEEGWETLFQKVFKQAKAGCRISQKMMIEYKFGKPVEPKENRGKIEVVVKYA